MADRDRSGEQFGEYRLLRKLGGGRFTEVYLGEHAHLQTKVAIKLLLAHVPAEEQQRFLEEARKAVHLEHPHIVRVLEVSVQQGIPFLAMEYMAGGTLGQRFPLGTPIPIETILPYIQQAAEALQYAHDQGVLHLDVRPENLLLDAAGKLLVADFGIAQALQTSPTSRGFIGAPAYAAPEHFMDQSSIGPASDQYALALIVYCWLAGAFPFQGDFVARVNSDLPPPLREHVPDFSPVVEAVVLRALWFFSDERYSSVRAFAEALTQASQMPSSAMSLLTYQGHSHLVNTVAWSPDSKWIVSGSEDKTAQVWDAVTGERLLIYQGHADEVDAIAWAPDGKRIASASGKVVHVWDAMTGERSLLYQGHADRVHAVAWAPDSRRIASASADNIIQTWDATTAVCLSAFPSPGWGTNALTWAPDGQRIAFGEYYGVVQVWDTATNRSLLSYSGHTRGVGSLAWAPDGRQIASASSDETVQVWEVATRERLLTYRGHLHWINAVAWSPDGRHLASGGADRTVQVWDATTGKRLAVYQGHTDYVYDVAWAPDSRRIASASYDGTVQVWDASQ